jgi:hypothetical protein
MSGFRFALLIAIGCTENGVLDAPLCEDGDAPAQPATGLTYTEDIAPIVHAKCGACHREGGLAPFPLETYEEIAAALGLVREAVESDEMPPWPPSSCCNDYLFDRSLTGQEKADLLAWIDQGAPEGEGPARTSSAALGGLDRVDLMLSMPAPYTPNPRSGTDDLRCFLLDWPFEDRRFVTGINVLPGNVRVVHHVIAYVADGDDLDVFERLDEQDPEPGWDCRGGVGARASGSIGGWAPGFSGVTFPSGLGREVEPGAAIVLNVHYEVLDPDPRPDQTVLQLRVDTAVEREAIAIGVFHPQWLIGGLSIEAGDRDAAYGFSYDPTSIFGGKPITIFNANLHMHELGTRTSMAILREGGARECLLQIEEWDYGWQGEYWLSEPARLEPGDQLHVECHWDNGEENQRVIGGQRQAPRDLVFANDGEMCVGFVLVAVDE